MARVVIVGCGQAGVEAAASLRSSGFDGEITMLGNEPCLPYHRPPLSKEYLAGESEVDTNTLRGESFYAKKDVELRCGVHATDIDRDARRIQLDSGSSIGYDHLVLATGARPRELPVPGAELAGVLPLRSLDDATALRAQLSEARRVVVVGAGFIGLECAAIAAKLGIHTTVVEFADRAMGRVVSERSSEFVVQRHREHGTDVLFGRQVVALHGADGRVAEVELDGGQRLPAQLVIVGVGVLPNTELAERAGLAVHNGIVVDERLRTEDERVYAIGDCANYPSRYAPGRVRLESVQNAVDQGRRVGASIAGTPEPYTAVPWFWTNQLSVRLQIAGLANGQESTVVRPGKDDESFSVFRFDGDRLAAVESINSPRDHMAARRLLGSGIALTPEQAADPEFDLKAHASG